LRVDKLREYLKPDPQGYYVITIDSEELAKIPRNLIESCIVEEISAKELVIKTRSRAIAKKLLILLKRI